MFIGRDFELNHLQSSYESDRFEFVVVYGRRRVGKTRLLREFTSDKPTLFFSAVQERDALALERFSSQVIDAFPELASVISRFESWDKALGWLIEQASHKRFILVIDEFPYLAESNPAISSILQHLADGPMQRSKLMLILCGSSMSFMEHQVLGIKSPLYGRRTSQLKLQEMNYRESMAFFPGWSDKDKLEAYMSVGGTPYYLQALARHKNYPQAIIKELLTPTGLLFDEPASLMNQEMRNPAGYHSLIRVIAQGATRVNQMATKLQETSSSVSHYLDELILLDLIEKNLPYGEKKGHPFYSVKNLLYRFYYTFVSPAVSSIAYGLGEKVFYEAIKPRLNEYFGHVFEEVAKEYLIILQQQARLPAFYQGFGRWWGSDPHLKQSIEVDVLGLSDHHVLLAECKYQTAPIGVAVLEQLQYLAKIIHPQKQSHLYLFSRSGFSDRLRQAAAHYPVTLVSWEDLIDP